MFYSIIKVKPSIIKVGFTCLENSLFSQSMYINTHTPTQHVNHLDWTLLRKEPGKLEPQRSHHQKYQPFPSPTHRKRNHC